MIPLLCALLEQDGAEDAKKGLMSELLSEAFLSFTDQQRLSGSLFPKLKKLQPDGEQEQVIWSTFQKRYQRQWAFNGRLLTIYKELLTTFEDKEAGRIISRFPAVFYLANDSANTTGMFLFPPSISRSPPRR